MTEHIQPDDAVDMVGSFTDWINESCPDGCWAMPDPKMGGRIIYFDPEGDPNFLILSVQRARVTT